MNKLAFISSIGWLAFGSTALSEETKPNSFGCYPREQVEKLLTEGNFETFSRGTTPDNKFNELWLNGKSQMVLIAFNKPVNNDYKSIKDVCIISMTSEVTYNGTTIQELYKALEKDSPKL